jgi:membrane protein
MDFEGLQVKLKSIYSQANQRSGGWLNLVAETVQRFNQAQAAQAAAAMAYYAFFSLFPLLLFLIIAASFIVQQKLVQQQLLGMVADALPAAQELIWHNIQRVLEARGTVSFISGLSLAWSASGFFTTLVYNVNNAWAQTDMRNFWQQRLIALTIVGLLAVLLILSISLTLFFNSTTQIAAALGGNVSLYKTWLWWIGAKLLPVVFRLLAFLGLYRWVPKTEVSWTAALSGALTATLGWQLTTIAFSWYLNSGLVHYEVVYGSLGALAGLMLWIYLSSSLILFGAHLSAAVMRHQFRKRAL